MALARGALLLASLVLIAQAMPAHAGSYQLYSCAGPDGTILPTDGWRAETAGAGGAASHACSYSIVPARALSAGLFTVAPSSSYMGWVFTAPSDTVIGGYTLWRTVRTASGSGWYHDYYFTHDVPRTLDQRYLVEFCSRYASCDGLGQESADRFSPVKRIARSNLEVRRLNAFVSCATTSAAQCEPGTNPGGYMGIHAARIDLTDPYSPAFHEAPRGSLFDDAPPLEGEKSISLNAGDRGAGIERVGIVVNGQRRLERAADLNSTPCRRPFTAAVPCSLKLSTTLVFDTATLRNGAHSVQASVTDAAGNETRSDPVTVTTRNGSRPNGRGASRFVRLSAWLRSRRNAQRSSVVVPYGSVRTAEGRLTDSAGAPIAGAVLDVKSRVRRPGARQRLAGTVTTSDSGRFAYRVARGPSQTLRFEYKAYSLDPAPVSTAAISLGVRAGLKLRLKPRHVRNGEKVRFRGRLKGGPARKGTRATIDVIVPDARRRVPIGNVKADANGRFRFAYRFRRTLVKARYRFQARLVPQPGYPYRGATSRRVSVFVQP